MNASEELLTPHPGRAVQVSPVLSEVLCRSEQCEMELNISVFMDGTGNNWKWMEEGHTHNQLERKKDSNVYRLYKSYPHAPQYGYYSIYVPGVGTPFEGIADEGGVAGQGAGAGGDGRINYALLQLFNSITRFLSNGKHWMFPEDVVLALCRNGKREYDPHGNPRPFAKGDTKALMKVQMERKGGLLRDPGDAQRREFLRETCQRIAKLIATGKPRIKRIVLDVFGFSRGAAQARVFCAWFGELMQDGKFCGVPAQIRFLGLFDTVASVGLPHSMPVIGSWADGHLDWATPENLRIGPHVKRCVHYVAMHEQRASFPVDTLRNPDGSLPPHCQQFTFPGMHSDVGGGYTPQEQGRCPDLRDSQKLSQIPLNLMYAAAKDALVPLNKELAKIVSPTESYDPFAIDTSLQTAYDAFTTVMGPQRRRLREWLLPYLCWRYQVRHEYTKLPWAHRADKTDRDDLRSANEAFLSDLALFEGPVGSYVEDLVSLGPVLGPANHARRRAQLDAEASEIAEYIRKAPPVVRALATFFADYVHDSYGGFVPGGVHEPAGYLRYRRQYMGNDNALTLDQPLRDIAGRHA